MLPPRTLPQTRRAGRIHAVAFLLMVLGCGAEAPEGYAQTAEPRDGTYRVRFENQALTLTLLTDPAGNVQGRLQGGTLDFQVQAARGIDEDGDPAVEGVMSGGGASGLFWLFLDEDDEYGLIVTPLDAQGNALENQAAYYDVEWASDGVQMANPGASPGPAAGSSPGAAPGPAPGTVPPASSTHPIVGRWATQVMMNSPGGTIATQLFMEFRPDGTMVDLGSRAMGGFGDAGMDTGYEGGGDQGAWRADGDLLYVSYQGSPWVPFARFQVDAARLALTYLQDGSVQLWYRQTQ